MPVAESPETAAARTDAEQVHRAVAKLRNLPASLMVVQRALDSMEEAFCSNECLQAILAEDPAATAGLLRLANSPYFGVGSQIRTPAMAITVVGHERLKTLLRHLIVGKLLESLSVDHPLAARIRDVALAAGVACHEIGRHGAKDDAEELRIAGLMHNVGETALLSELPELYERAHALAAGRPRDAAAIEVFGADYASISSRLLESWRFPRVYVEAVRQSDGLDDIPDESSARRYVRAVQVAATLAEAWLDEIPEEDALERIAPETWSELDLPADAPHRIYLQIGAGVEELRRAL